MYLTAKKKEPQGKPTFAADFFAYLCGVKSDTN
jgi:hypothetical protein